MARLHKSLVILFLVLFNNKFTKSLELRMVLINGYSEYLVNLVCARHGVYDSIER
jgi:hypothetical protein